MSFVRRLIARNKKVEKALRELVTQEQGRRNNWAGLWVDCWNCHNKFAVGGSWNNIDHEKEMCPFCTAKGVLSE